jgi:uncharacterized membrane-anchored protein
MSHRLVHAMVRAKAVGVLPDDAMAPQQDSRPWPVVLLTALGAWLAALPLLGMVGMLFGDLLTRDGGPYFVGLLVLAAAIVVLRSAALPLFVEQLAVPALLVGGGSLGFGLFRDLPLQGAAAVLALLALVLAWAIARPWLQVLLGALAAALTQAALTAQGGLESAFSGHGVSAMWLGAQILLLLWLALLWLQEDGLQAAGQARLAGAIESVAAGWLLATLAVLAMLSGMTFLVGGSLGSLGNEAAGEFALARGTGRGAWLMPLASVLAALLGAVRALRAWPHLRAPTMLCVLAVLASLAWFLTSLGAVLLALAVCVTTQRWRLAAACGVAAAWVLGSFYYLLDWPLATKALVLAGAGAALGGLAWLASRAVVAAPTAAPQPPWRKGPPPLWIALTALATLAAANVAIWQKEDLIAQGQPVFVELAPVDPRSLMQGDFMRLNFRLPVDTQGELEQLLTRKRPHAVARRDARGVATLLRIDAGGTALAADELRIELTPKNGRWILVTDAWFFKEGDGERWSRARYGEFRVAADGRALLVGMADADLRRIEP